MISEILDEYIEKMFKAVESVKNEFSNIRSGRANPAMFQKIIVSYYGSSTPLEQLASVNVVDARSIIINPYDKSALKDIESALRDAQNIGANPNNDGEIIRINLPELTQERRKEFVKIAKTKAEESRVSIRNLRRKAKDDLESLKSEIGEDEISRAEKELDSITKKHIDMIDDALSKKELDLLKV